MTALLAENSPVPLCPRCAGTHVVRNGPNSADTPTFRGRACRRRLVAAPRKGPVADDTKALVERLLAERVSLRGIARAVGVSRAWPQGCVNALYRERTPHDPGPLKNKPAGS